MLLSQLSGYTVKSVLEKNQYCNWVVQVKLPTPNPSKFQSFVIGKSNITSFTILSADNTPVEIECQNNFNSHVKDICTKDSRQINIFFTLMKNQDFALSCATLIIVHSCGTSVGQKIP